MKWIKLLCVLVVCAFFFTGCGSAQTSSLTQNKIVDAVIIGNFLLDEDKAKIIKNIMSTGIEQTPEQMNKLEIPMGGADLKVMIKNPQEESLSKFCFSTLGFSKVNDDNSPLYLYNDKKDLDDICSIQEQIKKSYKTEVVKHLETQVYIGNMYELNGKIEEKDLMEINNIIKNGKQISKEKSNKLTEKPSGVILEIIAKDDTGTRFFGDFYVKAFTLKDEKSQENLYFEYQDKDDFNNLIDVYDRNNLENTNDLK